MKKDTPTALFICRSWRAPAAFALLACEWLLYLLRALLRAPAMPFLYVAEWFYRLRRFRQAYWAETIEIIIEKDEARKEQDDESLES